MAISFFYWTLVTLKYMLSPNVPAGVNCVLVVVMVHGCIVRLVPPIYCTSWSSCGEEVQRGGLWREL